MFNVDDLYELLKTNNFDDVRASFDLALDTALRKHEKAIYQFGTHELPAGFYARLNTNDTTMEDIVLLLYTVLYRDYPELRESLDKGDYKKDAAELNKLIPEILSLTKQIAKVSNAASTDYDKIADFLGSLGL